MGTDLLARIILVSVVEDSIPSFSLHPTQKFLHLLPRRNARHGPPFRHGQSSRGAGEFHAPSQHCRILRPISISLSLSTMSMFQEGHCESGAVTIPGSRFVQRRPSRREGQGRLIHQSGRTSGSRGFQGQERPARTERDQDVVGSASLEDSNGAQYRFQIEGGTQPLLNSSPSMPSLRDFRGRIVATAIVGERRIRRGQSLQFGFVGNQKVHASQ
mmetsp:Transcript_29537/g.62717  ORF Transcript_29537/g.62717 Transcript_29537/m.62717 type:complete len:215 (+) Transcript_29537:1288-1932(+)